MRTVLSFKPALVAATTVTVSLIGAEPAIAGFPAENVSLYAWLDLNELGGAGNGNDCWGYVSPSGREYALMGVRDALYVVEITDPGNPVIIDFVPHTDTLWGDVKIYQTYAYVVNDFGGGGMDVIDLSDVDNGNVTLVTQITDDGLSTSHNVAVDPTSGYLYLAGANINGGRLVAYTLANPALPVEVGRLSGIEGTDSHDVQVVTYTCGSNAGKQIAFGSNEGDGLDIYDVTDKKNMVRLSRTPYPNLTYAHQGWLDEAGQYFYLNDEADGINETVVFDVTDLENPFVATTFDSGVGAQDHNVYVRDGFLYEAEYKAGLRISCVDDPFNPVTVGFFDTFPPDDSKGFSGAWSVYPFFPSGTVIISDISSGLYIVDVSAALAAGGGCETSTVLGDINGDGSVDIQDFLLLLGLWGPCETGNCPADLDGDCTVGILDFLLLLANWS